MDGGANASGVTTVASKQGRIAAMSIEAAIAALGANVVLRPPRRAARRVLAALRLAMALGYLSLAGLAKGADIDVTVQSHQSTSVPPGGRFEVMQSTLAARWTFRLDRFTGRIWQLVKTKDDDNAWEETQVYDRPPLSNPPRARFQLFTSGLAARHTFLLDGDTGKTWVLVTGKRKDKDGKEFEIIAWQPFANER